MPSDVPSGKSSDLDWLLSSLVQRVPHTRSALLLSSDGLKKAFHGLDNDMADHLSAVASGLFSLARSAGNRFGSSSGVRQDVAELGRAVGVATPVNARLIELIRAAEAGTTGEWTARDLLAELRSAARSFSSDVG